MQDLISFVQTHAKTKREDLAGEVLALVLREQPGQMVLRRLVLGSEAAEEAIEVITQRTAAGCVPDIHLVHHGKTIGLLELKLWASLTVHQLSGRYFDVAPVVLFVVPEERLPSLAEELSALISKHSLVLLSWTRLLAMLEKAEEGSDRRDRRLYVGALEHLKEFCNVIEQERFDPFTADQLRTPIEDVSAQHLVWLTREVITSAVAAQVISEAGRLGAGFDSFFYYGQNVMLGTFHGWLGYWPHAWKRFAAHGPLWIQFYGRDANAILGSGSFTDGLKVMGNDVAFPLFPSSKGPFSSQEEEVNQVAAAVGELVQRLRQAQVNPTSL
jgi:hypothetical protein